MNRKYTDAQIMWLEQNCNSRLWKNRNEFLKEFNKTFNLDVSAYKFNNLVLYYNIKIVTEQTESLFTAEEKEWLIENAKSGVFKSCADLTETFNVFFKQHRKKENLYSYLYQWDVTLNTSHNNNKYSKEMDAWICKNFEKYTYYEELTQEFNKAFGANKAPTAIAHRCVRLGLKRPSTRFKAGDKINQKPVGTVVKRKDEYYVKVNEKNDKSSWVPLKRVVYERENGDVPKGYCVISLDGNKYNIEPKNLYCIDRRGTVIMAKLGWFTENKAITRTGARWCNLYCLAKDEGIVI